MIQNGDSRSTTKPTKIKKVKRLSTFERKKAFYEHENHLDFKLQIKDLDV